ncbi:MULTISPECIES: phage integrase central domain-containing protein [Lonsdalea]|uniref:Uncharacterized protein n=2 Tax=Lonsdalea TaxID=1082702 RepID=A0ACD1JFP4_9GAMM|nr:MULTISPECIES: DUF4102 domain-containing protein [Lonsdalea]OSN00001.1 hypothetical protein AU499_11105 [Lonsdalea populi]QPQ25060.1 DUF4102 domain-containing protein [Lonsdalea populi]RAT15478.1 hypothetical protein AU485_03630 [Lonsdalea quercina]RAT19890.1 hypothetical protein AU487_09575 [Lonsdalea populi]RAT24006.1 hypothetical protein AU489_10360 [Lonsdalea populi]
MDISTFIERYISLATCKLTQAKAGSALQTLCEMACLELQELTQIRNEGLCPATELRKKAKTDLRKPETANPALISQRLVEIYLSERIKDRNSTEGKIIPGARKKKGQMEVRRILQHDAVAIIGDKIAAEVTRKEIIDLVNIVLARGANVQAGHLLRELSSAYEFAIGSGRLDENFANSAPLAKSSLRQIKIKLTCGRGTRVPNEKEPAKFSRWLPGPH